MATDWSAIITYSVGTSSAFGIYDSDALFVTQSTKVAKYVIRSLGYPVMDVQLDTEHVFTNFQSAITKYTTLVNEYKIRDHMLDMFGVSGSFDVTYDAVLNSFNGIYKISQMYGQQSVIKATNTLDIKSASIPLIDGQQDYDLSTLLPNPENKQIQLVRIYHGPVPAIYRFYDPFVTPGMGMNNFIGQFGWDMMAPGIRYMMIPVFEDLLRMQAIQLNDQIRRSGYGFQVRGHTLRIFPVPRNNLFMWLDYVYRQDKVSNSIVSDSINNISNFPIYDYIQYNKINTPGRNWIWRYTLALCKQTLGIIRGKYGSSIPYTQQQQSTDGDTLRNEARTQQDLLVEELKAILEQGSLYNLMMKKKQMAQNMQGIMAKAPLPIFIG